MIKKILDSYKKQVNLLSEGSNVLKIEKLADDLYKSWKLRKNIYICGNGGSAANAIHIANDFIYGAGKSLGKGFKVEALSSNSSVITCLANDIGYENIYSEQIRVKGEKGDVLIVLSGSGNSKNILKALKIANKLGLKTHAILGFNGGLAKKISKNVIHFSVNDMQISEDLQLVVGHACMKYLSKKKNKK
ncbi:SIS domain-containing protein [Candidatus Pelagibacter sp.]|jgi:D-sedoheptulose 7-phosphate isomerase|nr:SIS domain-containing protein [Candidatus Pelagibacter sp.]|tara:strand:+ start:5133 stop:5702 length:570 start_codon:yes stop_codon:yes gene_type:complete